MQTEGSTVQGREREATQDSGSSASDSDAVAAFSFMISIPAINAWITCGDFVRARNIELNNQIVVCQVNKVLSSSTLSVTWWYEDEFLDAGYKSQRVPLIQTELTNVMKCSIKEVTKMEALTQHVVTATDVASVAFVFHASYLEHVWVNCAGMELVYYTRYFIDNNNSLSLLHPDLLVPFMHTGVQENYPS